MDLRFFYAIKTYLLTYLMFLLSWTLQRAGERRRRLRCSHALVTLRRHLKLATPRRRRCGILPGRSLSVSIDHALLSL